MSRHVSLVALPFGVCPQCHRQPIMRFGGRVVGCDNWATCPQCKLCYKVGSGLLTPPDGLDIVQEIIDLSAYRERDFILDIGPPYQPPWRAL